MTRAAALAGVLALAAAGSSLALPTVLDTTTGTQVEWTETPLDTTEVTMGEMGSTTSGTTPTSTGVRMMEAETTTPSTPEAPQQQQQMPQPQPQPQQTTPVPEAVLEAIMQEMQNIFRSSLVPGWDTVGTAADAVRQIVTRVRERLTGPLMMTEMDTGLGRTGPLSTTGATGATTGPVAALRGVTNDFLREIMIQEAVLETLWAVVRDAQERPWLVNEQEALHAATADAVQGFLGRMHDRLRATGFSEEEVMRLLPRSRNGGCTRTGGLFDQCNDAPPSRLLGKRMYSTGYYGYGYPSYYSYGYSYPAYSHYPVSYPYYGYSWGPSYYYGSGYYGKYGYKYGHYYRRLAEQEPRPVMPPAAATAAANLRAAAAAAAEVPPPPPPAAVPPPPPAAAAGTPAMMPPPMMGVEEPVPFRSLYPSYSWSYPAYTRVSPSYSYYTPSYSSSYYYPRYNYAYNYPLYSDYSWYDYSYPLAYSSYSSYPLSYSSYSYPLSYTYPSAFYRRLEVPDLTTTTTTHHEQQQQQQQESTTTAVPTETITTPSTRNTHSSSLRRVGERYEPITPTQRTFYNNTEGTNNPVYTPENLTEDEPQTVWETYN